MKKITIITIVLIAVLLLVSFTPRSYTYDANKAAEYVTTHAARRSQGLCAQYVRLALEHGGCNTWGHPLTAHGYNDFLECLEFTCIDNKNYCPQKGDIVVFSAVIGHPYGHIAMWNGRQWVSDFKQKGLFVANAYTKARNQKYYRMTNEHPKRHFKLEHYIKGLGIEPVIQLFQLINRYL